MSELYHITHSGDKGVNEIFFGSAGMLMLGLVAGEVKGLKGRKGRAGWEGRKGQEARGRAREGVRGWGG